MESVSKNDVLDPSVCSIINSLRSDLYYVTCTDNSSTSAVTISTAPDYTEQYLGCVITELFQPDGTCRRGQTSARIDRACMPTSPVLMAIDKLQAFPAWRLASPAARASATGPTRYSTIK